MAEVARQLGFDLMPHQRLMVDVAYEYDENGFVYDEIDALLPRQEGKTALDLAVTYHRLVVMARTHGRQRSMYMAQNRLKARERLDANFAAALRDSPAFAEVLHNRVRPNRETQWRLSMNNGSENIGFGNGSKLQIDAPSRTGSHGDTLDHGTIDEAFAHEDNETETGMRPTMATRRDAQIWVLSAAGDGRSFYLYRKLLAGRKAAETGDHGRVAYFEWSAPDEADPSDPAVWRACSPAMGITIDERFIQGEWDRAQREGTQDAIDLFRRSYLNQWPNVPVLGGDEVFQVFPGEQWAQCGDETSEIDGRMFFGLAVAEDRSQAAFAAAGASTLGGVHAEITGKEGMADYRPGTTWVPRRAVELLSTHGGRLAILKGSPAAAMIADLRKAGVAEDDIVEVSVEEYARQCGQMFDLVTSAQFHHIGQTALDVAVRGAAKRYFGDSWVLSQKKASTDISPLVAAVGAVGLHVATIKPRKPATSKAVTGADEGDFFRPAGRLDI